MVNQKPKTLVFLCFLTFLLGLSIYSVATTAEIPKTSGTAPMKNIVIDGTISEAEWANRDWKIKFYLNIDDLFNPPDKDGFNYMYLGEDYKNFYVGLDLCSDQTGDPTDEWVGVWLNVNNRSFDDLLTWASYIDNGTESLLHDVEHDDFFPYFRDELQTMSGGYDVNNDGEYTAVYGTTQGDYTLFNDILPTPSFNITSALVSGDNVTRLDFAIDIKEWYALFPEIYAANVQAMRLYIECRSSTVINDNKVVFWYSDGTMNPDDPLQTIAINNGTSWVSKYYPYGVANLSSDHIMRFSIIGNHSAPFTTYFEQIEFAIQNNRTNTFNGAMINPYHTISNYEIEWTFGPSANNASNHRMFEIKIPKSELEHYDSDEEIGIIVGGYGTMTFPNEVFWCFGEFNNSIRSQKTENYKYYNMGGIASPPSRNIPGYILPAVIALVIVTTFSILRKQKNAFKL
jgi:hypothetical protein